MTKTIRSDDPRERLIFALDIGGDFDDVVYWVGRLSGHVGVFKVGKELFTRYGPRVVELVKSTGTDVFLDLKYHDIPNTVARAAEAAAELGVKMFNVHALGGQDMMKLAMKALQRVMETIESPRPWVLAVTILTSLSDEDLEQMGFGWPIEELVPRLARLAQDAGVDGIVCSPREIEAVRHVCGDEMVIVTPGVRGWEEIAGDDQKRTLSAREAIAAGADYVVVGRPIRVAADPVQEAQALVEEITAGLEDRKRRCRRSTA